MTTPSFRLRRRAHFAPSLLISALHLHPPRTSAPPSWQWTWPLCTTATPTATQQSISTNWASSIRSVTISDDATHLAFITDVTSDAILLTLHPNPHCVALLLPLDTPATATCATFLTLTDTVYLAVGYSTGVVAIFSTSTYQPILITRPSQTAFPIRTLRLHTALQLTPFAPTYPTPSPNAALIALLSNPPTLAQLPLSHLPSFLSVPSSDYPIIDQKGAPWTLWNIPAQRAVLDAAPCASDPSSICEPDLPPGEAPLRFILAGFDPPLAAYSVSNSPAFSARDAAKRAASSVLSAAKGFLLSRISSAETAQQQQSDDTRKALNGVARFLAAWADHTPATYTPLTLTDVRDSARKSVTAVLSRGRKTIDIQPANNPSPEPRRSLPLPPPPARDPFHTLDDYIAPGIPKPPQNARIVHQVSSAPLPCSLLATCDTLGRIFVQDSRDLCVLRILKGYRDARVAWLAQPGPLFAVLAPRLNVLELHRPLQLNRLAAFRLSPGSMLVQSAIHRVFCLSPDGHLYELVRARKSDVVSAAAKQRVARPTTDLASSTANANVSEVHSHDFATMETDDASSADYELVGAFLEAVKRGQTSSAVECLQRVEDDARKVAHLMATLVTCASYVRTEVHVALSSKAAQIAANLKDRDLLSRFEAHGRLAEAFALVFAEVLPDDSAAEENRVAMYGNLLMEDDIGAGLLEFAIEELKIRSSPSRLSGKRARSASNAQDDLVNCERFILSHALQPATDLRAEIDFVLRPRADLSLPEQVWLAKVYFSRLLHVDSADFPTEGREHPATKDVFLALTEFVGLSEADVTKQFAMFFLNVPLLPLLKTHVSTHASPIRCAIARLRTRFSSEAVDQILIEECETSARIPNAVLLTRLCALHERRRSRGNDAPFMASLDRLEEVLLFRKFVAGSTIPEHVYEKFTARGCTGVPGDAQRHALERLIEWNDFERAAKVLASLEESRQRQNLEWHESASVSEAALHACRKKSGRLITEAGRKLIPEGVVTWILAVESGEDQSQWDNLLSENREKVLRQIRAVLLSAHQYFSDSSVDAVRCLQLAEAMSALIELEVEAEASKKTESEDIAERGAYNGVSQPDHKSHTNASAMIADDTLVNEADSEAVVTAQGPPDRNERTAHSCTIASPQDTPRPPDSEIMHPDTRSDDMTFLGGELENHQQATQDDLENSMTPKAPIMDVDSMSLDKDPRVPVLETAALDSDALDAVPTMAQESDEALPEAVAAENPSTMEVDGEMKDASDEDEKFVDAVSRRTSDSVSAGNQNDMEVEEHGQD